MLALGTRFDVVVEAAAFASTAPSIDPALPRPQPAIRLIDQGRESFVGISVRAGRSRTGRSFPRHRAAGNEAAGRQGPPCRGVAGTAGRSGLASKGVASAGQIGNRRNRAGLAQR